LSIKLGNGLLIANLLSWILILIILIFPDSPIRIVLGIPFILLFPGYALISALIPAKTGISGIERLALSFGLSIALVILVGLGLNYTPFGIRLNPIMFSIAGLLLGLSVIAWVRSRRLPDDERFSMSLHFSWNSVWSGKPIDKVLSLVLVIAILASIGAVAYTIAKPKPGEEFTEFYILGTNGKAADYPSNLTLTEQTSVTVGIINNFRNAATYEVVVTIDSVVVKEMGPFELSPKEKLEQQVAFTPLKAGDNQKVEFLLTKDASPAETLHIWIDVTE